MRNKEKAPRPTELSTIVDANIGKRLLTAIIDALFFGFLGVMLLLWVFRPIANYGLHYEQAQADETQYRIASHLYVYRQANDDNQYVIIEVKDFTEKYDPNRASAVNPIYGFTETDYKFYLEHLYYYYHSFLTNVDVELPNSTATKQYDPVKDMFVSPHYNDPINGVLPKDYYTDDWFINNVLDFSSGESTYFNYDSSKETFMEKITVKDGVDSVVLINYLKKCCNTATSDFYYSDYNADLNNIIKWSQVVIFVPSIVISYSIFYLLIPLLYSNGETLAKKFFKVAVISANGYKVKRRQIVFRELLQFAILAFSAFVVGIGLTSLATLGVAIVILLGATLISKDHRSPIDYAASTEVVDAQKSVWFESLEDELNHAKELEDNMAKYKNQNILNKNVIQVGTTIVDEEVKKEFEESKKDSKKQH